MPLCLIAILPGDDIDQQVKTWKNFMLDEFGCKVALKSPAHITLIPPFNLGNEKLSSLKSQLRLISDKNASFYVELKNFGAFPPAVIYVNVLENQFLNDIKSNVENALISYGFPIKKANRSFHPHVNIANRDLEKKDFPSAWNHFKNQTFHHSFQANSISLLEHTGQKWNCTFEAGFTW